MCVLTSVSHRSDGDGAEVQALSERPALKVAEEKLQLRQSREGTKQPCHGWMALGHMVWRVGRVRTAPLRRKSTILVSETVILKYCRVSLS